MITKVINTLIDRNLFCYNTGTISDDLRYNYAKVYAELSNGDFNNLSSSNKKYALKLAGLNLSKCLVSKTSGFIYCIGNPSYPNYVKVGITYDVNKRLAAYQTYDPYRSFYIITYRFVEDKAKLEKHILKKYKVDVDKGEWVSNLDVIVYIKSLF
jgi:hypothetical protein